MYSTTHLLFLYTLTHTDLQLNMFSNDALQTSFYKLVQAKMKTNLSNAFIHPLETWHPQ